MSTRFKLILIATALSGASVTSHAAGVGVRAGTDGLGADVAFDDLVPYVPGTSLRLGVSELNFNHSVNSTNVSYQGKIKLEDGSALLDFAPLGPLFRISGGLMFGNNRLTLTGQPTSGAYSLGNNTYQASQVGSVNAEIKPHSSASPYLGIGFGRVSGAGVNFYSDFGAIFNGGMKASVNASCGASMPAATCAQFQSDAAVESQKLQSSVNTLKVWPVARVGITIGF